MFTTWNPLARDLPALAPQHVRLSADLFAPEVPCAAIDRALADVAQHPYHTFSVFTEYPERMLAYFTERDSHLAMTRCFVNFRDYTKPAGPWPLPNLALGVLIHTQAEADARLPVLLQVPAAVRAVRVVPREAVTLRRFLCCPWCKKEPPLVDGMGTTYHLLNGVPMRCPTRSRGLAVSNIHWVTVAGEADPVHPQHVRDLCREAETAGVPFAFEGWGEWVPCGYPLPDQQEHAAEFALAPLDEPWDGRCSDDGDVTRRLDGNERMAAMARVGAERSGRVLNGVVYDTLPEAWERKAMNTIPARR